MPRRPSRGPGWSVPIARVFGVPLRVHASFLLLPASAPGADEVGPPLEAVAAVVEAVGPPAPVRAPTDGRPDLVVADLRVTRSRVIGKPAKITVKVSNVGGAPAGAFEVVCSVDGARVGAAAVEGLDTEEISTQKFEYTAPTTGFHVIEVVLGWGTCD